MKTLSKEEYSFIVEYVTKPCGGGCSPRRTYSAIGMADMVEKVKAAGYLQLYACHADAKHWELSALGKSAMQCYEFAHRVMDLALS
jgi:hypothetical protein